MSEPKQSSYPTPNIYRGWLPQNPEIHAAFLQKHVVETRPQNGTYEPTNRYVKAFIKAIEGSKVMKPLSKTMFDQVRVYTSNPNWAEEKSHQVDNLDHLGAILDSIVASGPKFWKLRNSEGKVIGEPVGVPIYAALDMLSNTSAGYDLFRWQDFNDEMEKLLNGWGDFLKEQESGNVFNDEKTGWFCPEGLKMLEEGLKGKTFDETFDTELPAPRRYNTWDSFFIRKFKGPELRPIEVIKGLPVINNACESTTLYAVPDVQLQDRFWLKGHKYSLYDMLGGDPEVNPESLSKYAQDFVGGSVYQAFLSPQDFHHWHSPVKGKILDTAKLNGTYFATLLDDGSPGDDGFQERDPHGALIRSQPWLSISAARAVIVIQPDNEEIEMVAFIGIGMVEVSTIDIVKGRGDNVDVGEELGMFHFGGSSHVVIIKLKNPGQKQLVFKDINNKPVELGQHRWINSIIARVENK